MYHHETVRASTSLAVAVVVAVVVVVVVVGRAAVVVAVAVGVGAVNPIVDELTATAPPIQWLLPGLLPQGHLTVLAGSPGAGKSFLAYTLGLALAGGVDTLDIGTQPPAPVVYFDQENAMPDRIQYERWAWHGLGCPPVETLGVHFWPYPFALGGFEWSEVAEQILLEHGPRLVVFDTATPCFNIRDENDNGEAHEAITQLRRLQGLIDPPATMLVLKHMRVEHIKGESERYTVRGAKAWVGAADSVIFQLRQRGRPSKDGLIGTRLVPEKVRAFGLRDVWYLKPTRTDLGIHLAVRREA